MVFSYTVDMVIDNEENYTKPGICGLFLVFEPKICKLQISTFRYICVKSSDNISTNVLIKNQVSNYAFLPSFAAFLSVPLFTEWF